jgi:hypothetical protein
LHSRDGWHPLPWIRTRHSSLYFQGEMTTPHVYDLSRLLFCSLRFTSRADLPFIILSWFIPECIVSINPSIYCSNIDHRFSLSHQRFMSKCIYCKPRINI